MGFRRWRLLQDSGQRKIVINKQVKFFEVTKSTGVENNAEQVDTETADELVVGGAVDAPAASGATDALGAGQMDAPGVQAQWTPVQGCGGLCGAPGRSWRRDGRACSSLGAQWTRLLTESWARSTAQLMELEAHWVRLVMGWRRNGRAPAQAEARWTRCAWSWRRDGRACSWELRGRSACA
jgi:hypothetical protein